MSRSKFGVRTDKEWKEDCTLLAHFGVNSDPQHGSVTLPLYPSSTFAFRSFGKSGVYDYTRSGNPTRDELAKAIADLERGDHATVTSSGISAVGLALNAVKAGDLVIASHDCYGGTYRLLHSKAEQGHFRLKFADLTDTSKLDEIFAEAPKLVLIETPSNPLLRITDIDEVSRRAHAVGALVAVDNTFMSPLLQKPLRHGADIVVHSLTKYINGHSDVVGGAAVFRTKDLLNGSIPEYAKPTSMTGDAWWANATGVTGSPQDSWLVMRGLHTLASRIEKQTETAGKIAQFLEQHPAIERVYYPGLADHPGHDLATRQQKGAGGMLSLELKNPDWAEPFVNTLIQVGPYIQRLERGNDKPLMNLSVSLGGYETLIAHPASMTHASMAPEARKAAGISDGLVRISVGLESANHLIGVLKEALDPLAPKTPQAAPRRGAQLTATNS